MEDNKININMGYDKLSKDEISSHKNFNKVYDNYLNTQVKPMKVAKKYTITKMVVVTTVTAVVTVGIWKYASTRQTAATNTAATSKSNNTRSAAPVQGNHQADIKAMAANNITAKKAYIHPPLKGVDVPYKTYKVNAAKGGVITYNKSKISIPPKAFCDEKGDDVSGTVVINYREFHNAIDFFVSGIPMTYDSAGEKYTFESAGMLDMQGSQNGNPVYIKEGKNIKVSMSTLQTGTKYNVYMLDTVKRNWTYMVESKYELTSSKIVQSGSPQGVDTTALTVIRQEEKKLESAKPVQPHKAAVSSNTFSIDASAKEFPELAVYKNMVFEVDSTDKSFDPRWQRTTWSDAKLTRGGNANDYVFTVSNGSVKHDIMVHPAFKGGNYDEALKEYNLKYDQYLAEISKKQAEEKRQRDEYEKQMADIQKRQLMASVRNSTESNALQYLNINKFGIWNCDNPENIPKGAQLMASYTDEKNDDLNGLNVFVVQKNKNAIYEYYPGHSCNFNPSEHNFAWLVTPDNKIAVYTPEDFKQIKQKRGNFKFVMKLNDFEIKSISEVEQILKPYM